MNQNLNTFFQKTLSVGPLSCNCQILVSPETHEAVLVDPGDEGERIVSELKKIEAQLGIQLKVKALLHTHAHFDHVGGTRKVKEHFLNAKIDAPQIYLHQADELMYSMLQKQGEMFGMPQDAPLSIDQFLVDEQTLQFGKMKFTVLHTPGHSPGGLCFRLHDDSALQIPETVFTGDTLFKESVGRSDLWGGDEKTLVKSIHERLLTLDGDTIAWPGHGFQTTIGHEKLKNPYL
jgi:hydroxyacylglutathione hydrolase